MFLREEKEKLKMGRFDQSKKPVNPIFFMEDKDNYKVNPIYMVDNVPNSDTRFAILRTTDGGKYMRGGMLFYSLNGVEIYTEPNNVIFIDTENKVMFIKEYDKVLNEITPTDPEHRQYIILMATMDGTEEVYIWQAMEGRTAMYEYIRDNIEELNIDPENSFVLVENVPYKDALAVSNFVRYLKNGNLVEDDGFDIESFC